MNRQLRQELSCLRKRAALRPGLDSLRNCARCLTELGRILNRGALCPLCLKKVCKDCRQYGDENHEWLCIYCFKQMQLKAISGEWMQEFSKLSVRRCVKDPPGDQLRKVLHESQRKGLLDPDAGDIKKPTHADPPQKPPRIFQYEQIRETSPLPSELGVPESDLSIPTKSSSAEIFDNQQADAHQNLSPKILPRVSPWNGIDPEPTIPMRVDKSRSFGSVQQYNLPDHGSYRERQSSDEGHCTIGYRSRSTSSEVIDERENLAPVPLPRKRLSPLKKQQAIPEPNPVEKQQSSVDTVDSGVSSPGLKMENSIEANAPPSPLATARSPSAEQDAYECHSNRPSSFVQRLASESSSSESEAQPAQKTDSVLFRKVTLKKRKADSGPKTLKGKRSATVTAAETNSPSPLQGLNSNTNKTPNHSRKNKSKRKATHSNANTSNNNCPNKKPASNKQKDKNNSFSNNSVPESGEGVSLPNPEARPKGGKKSKNRRRKERRDNQRRELLASCKNQECNRDSSEASHSELKAVEDDTSSQQILTESPASEPLKEQSDHQPLERCNSNTNSKSEPLRSRMEFDFSRTLFRSASLPHRKTFTQDWLQSWLWKCHSLDDWLWFLEDQPNQTRCVSQSSILADDYKLVYVSSASESDESPFTNYPLQIQVTATLQNEESSFSGNLEARSPIKINCDRSSHGDSCLESKSNGRDVVEKNPLSEKNSDLIQASKGGDIIARSKELDQEQKSFSSAVEKQKCRSYSAVARHDFWYQEMKLKSPFVQKSEPALSFNKPFISSKPLTVCSYNQQSSCSLNLLSKSLVFQLSNSSLETSFPLETCRNQLITNKYSYHLSSLDSEIYFKLLPFEVGVTKELIGQHNTFLYHTDNFRPIFSCANFVQDANVLNVPNSTYELCGLKDVCVQFALASFLCSWNSFLNSALTPRSQLNPALRQALPSDAFNFLEGVRALINRNLSSSNRKGCEVVEILPSSLRVNAPSVSHFLLDVGEILDLNKETLFPLFELIHRLSYPTFGDCEFSSAKPPLCNPSWRSDCYEQVENSLLHLGDANAVRYAAALPPRYCDPINRSNDESAATGCWGKGRSAELFAAFLRWAAGSAKLGAAANAFFYHGPPVALKPEADYRRRPTRSDPRPPPSRAARMIALESPPVAAEDYVVGAPAKGFAMEDDSAMEKDRLREPARMRKAAGKQSGDSPEGHPPSKCASARFKRQNNEPPKLCDVLMCVRHLFSCEAAHSYDFPAPADCGSSDVNERVDCHCHKPCDVPMSPSVVDATVDAPTLAEDGEIFSSGDELDKLESDTDSQDTVIEGEAYKRIRSVAIKEKILHANEELFGESSKDVNVDSSVRNTLVSQTSEKSLKNTRGNKDIAQKGIQKYFHAEPQTDKPVLPLFSNCDESLDELLSFEKQFKRFKEADLSTLCSVSSLPMNSKKNLAIDSCDFINISSEVSSSSSYKASFCENVCSSESSDNGSDGEEVILSDTSTSSDEATYIAPSSGFRYYGGPLVYRLHTIVEESCEESEKSSRGPTPTNKHTSESERTNKTSKFPRKVLQKSASDSNIVGNSKTGKSSAAYAVLATSRLEKYFKSGLLKGEMSYPEDDMTDESGGVSSDDEQASFIRNKAEGGNIQERLSKKESTSGEKLSKSKSLSAVSGSHKRYNSNSESYKQSSEKKRSPTNLTQPTKFISQTEPSTSSGTLNNNSESMSDDDAKYIMSHLMQHITTNTDKKPETHSESKEVSMFKILESEIARLMLTVSPASLSAGEPSSSCSSTIGSNNSDYGSDTLESAEDTSDGEISNPEIVPDNRPLLDFVPPSDPENSDVIEDSSSNNDNSLAVSHSSDSVVSEETLYICKQLMASLKKIADVPDETAEPEDVSSTSEDHSAKQYITDQIVSLMQTVSASHSSSLLRTFHSNSPLQLDSDSNQDRSDSDSPPLNDEKRHRSKSKTPSESGSETTISASISIPSYDDSDRTPTESEISHEMDELYALLENSTHQDSVSNNQFSFNLDSNSQDTIVSSRDPSSSLSEEDGNSTSSESCDMLSSTSESHSSLLCGAAASKLKSLLPITVEERIARYKDAYVNKVLDNKETDHKLNETRINVILPQPSKSDGKNFEEHPGFNNKDVFSFNSSLKPGESYDGISSASSACKSEENYNITSVKIISHNTYPLSSAIHKILSSNIDSKYMEQKLDYQIVNMLETSTDKISDKENTETESSILSDGKESDDKKEPSTSSSVLKVMNPKEKASSENDLLVANYRTKSKSSKVFGTKSVGNISDLENISNKSGFRDTGYYSFKSSEESFLSLDDSTASQTSTASLTQYRSLTSTETIPEEEESCAKGTTPAKISLSSSNIPDAVCDASPSKSSTLPLSLRSKLSVTPGGNHRSRSSFFSTSGVLRKLTLLRDESGNSLRSSPHGRLRMRNRSLSGGSEDGRQRKASVPQISVSECSEAQIGRLSIASSEKDSSGVQEDEIDQAFAYHCRSQMSLSSFGVGGRSESVTSVYSAAGGGRYGTVTVTGEVLFGLNYNYKTSTLEITIKECRNLAAVDVKRNRSDPYVKVYLLPDRTKSGKRKTKVKKHTLNPMFEECLKFHVTVGELEIRNLWLSVWHSDRFGRNDFLGEVMLPLGNDTVESSGSKWYPLQERLETFDTPVSYKGDLILALKYVPPDVTSRKFSKKPGVPVKGKLEVLVREACNLMATRSNGTSDPFCKSYLLPDKSKSGKQKTPVLKKSCNPKWNHTFVYDDVSLDDLRERCLELTIWDYDKITSNDFLGGVRLCLGTGKYQGRDVDWMDSIGEERSLWYTMLERPNTWVDGSLLLRPNMQSRKSV